MIKKVLIVEDGGVKLNKGGKEILVIKLSYIDMFLVIRKLEKIVNKFCKVEK